MAVEAIYLVDFTIRWKEKSMNIVMLVFPHLISIFCALFSEICSFRFSSCLRQLIFFVTTLMYTIFSSCLSQLSEYCVEKKDNWFSNQFLPPTPNIWKIRNETSFQVLVFLVIFTLKHFSNFQFSSGANPQS